MWPPGFDEAIGGGQPRGAAPTVMGWIRKGGHGTGMAEHLMKGLAMGGGQPRGAAPTGVGWLRKGGTEQGRPNILMKGLAEGAGG